MVSVIITIFGATGDLAEKRLFPALFHLYKKGFLKDKFHIVGFSRRPWQDAEFQEYVADIFKKDINTYDSKTVNEFLTHVHYVSGDINDLASYKKIQNKLGSLDELENVCLNKVFYLAVTPVHYEITLNNISLSGLTIPCLQVDKENNVSYTRIFIEKPFGNNLKEAEKLDKLLGTLFDETQIFRIDHYLAKETLQNILSFRFANSIFEPNWNKDHIEKIVISLLEKNTVGKRGESYDPVGALRDVGQNHILQMLAFVTMPNPGSLKGDAVRLARGSIFEKVHYVHQAHSLVRAQYEGYNKEPGVSPHSETETYFRAEVSLDNETFKGVPIILESGKGFFEAKTEIVIYFKPRVSGMFSVDEGENIKQNILTFSIYPKEHISLSVFAKKPNFDNKVTVRAFNLSEKEEASEPDAYQKVLFDGLSGDNTLFASTQEVLAEWRLITEILEHYPETKLLSYPVGSKVQDIL